MGYKQVKIYGLRVTTLGEVTKINSIYKKGSMIRPTEVHIKTRLIEENGLISILESGANQYGGAGYRASKCKLLLDIITEHMAAE
ncbi:hypothetical protein NVP1112O_24 [Vibrio phage 1.112.O._10N.286.46.B11]|nr:hypothetical protein NVP1112O_24 [Vibrio phage 1.112.O._10N.286.46.B11]